MDAFWGMLGVIVGGFISFSYEKYFRHKDRQANISHGSSMLMYDLMSIRNFFKSKAILDGAKINSSVNIRYFNDWQTAVASCLFLTDEQIELLYAIYDSVFDFNNSLITNNDADEIISHQTISNIMFSDTSKFDELISILKCHAKK